MMRKNRNSSVRRIGLYSVAVALVWVCVMPRAAGNAQPAAKGPGLRIYFVDVEGGQSTLFVTPKGQSLLVDTGWPDFGGRDAGRIVAAAKDAGISRLDYVLLTHYHGDHSGGLPQLAERMPIGTVIDHGENAPTPEEGTEPIYQAYMAVVASGKVKRLSPKPGDKLPIPELDATVVTAAGEVIEHALPGAGQPNSSCAGADLAPTGQTENPRSLGIRMVFGKLRILDLGDLTVEKEALLMCPANKLGRVEILVVSHHGTTTSSSSALVHAIAPRVAVMDNGGKKGGSPDVWERIKSSPGLEDLWQLHTAEAADSRNVSDEFIANLPGTDSGNYLKLTAWLDGSFEVFNARTKATKSYPAK